MGCAFTIPDLGITKRYKLNKGASIFTAELYAILMACSYVNDLPNPPLAVAILSDSKSSLQALARGGTRNRACFQQEILFLAHQIIRCGTDLTFMWLPSHTGIRGNDLADHAAKAATQTGTPVETNQPISIGSEEQDQRGSSPSARRSPAAKMRGSWMDFPKRCEETLPKIPTKTPANPLQNPNFCRSIQMGQPYV